MNKTEKAKISSSMMIRLMKIIRIIKKKILFIIRISLAPLKIIKLCLTMTHPPVVELVLKINKQLYLCSKYQEPLILLLSIELWIPQSKAKINLYALVSNRKLIELCLISKTIQKENSGFKPFIGSLFTVDDRFNFVKRVGYGAYGVVCSALDKTT